MTKRKASVAYTGRPRTSVPRQAHLHLFTIPARMKGSKLRWQCKDCPTMTFWEKAAPDELAQAREALKPPVRVLDDIKLLSVDIGKNTTISVIEHEGTRYEIIGSGMLGEPEPEWVFPPTDPEVADVKRDSNAVVDLVLGDLAKTIVSGELEANLQGATAKALYGIKEELDGIKRDREHILGDGLSIPCSKDDMLGYAAKYKVHVFKSWTKQRITDALENYFSKRVTELKATKKELSK